MLPKDVLKLLYWGAVDIGQNIFLFHHWRVYNDRLTFTITPNHFQNHSYCQSLIHCLYTVTNVGFPNRPIICSTIQVFSKWFIVQVQLYTISPMIDTSCTRTFFNCTSMMNNKEGLSNYLCPFKRCRSEDIVLVIFRKNIWRSFSRLLKL